MPKLVGIDVETKHLKSMLRALRRLRGTVYAEDNGRYRMDSSYSQVMYCGSMDETAMDAWACRVKAARGFIGTWTPQGDTSHLVAA